MWPLSWFSLNVCFKKVITAITVAFRLYTVDERIHASVLNFSLQSYLLDPFTITARIRWSFFRHDLPGIFVACWEENVQNCSKTLVLELLQPPSRRKMGSDGLVQKCTYGCLMRTCRPAIVLLYSQIMFFFSCKMFWGTQNEAVLLGAGIW